MTKVTQVQASSLGKWRHQGAWATCPATVRTSTVNSLSFHHNYKTKRHRAQLPAHHIIERVVIKDYITPDGRADARNVFRSDVDDIEDPHASQQRLYKPFKCRDWVCKRKSRRFTNIVPLLQDRGMYWKRRERKKDPENRPNVRDIASKN